MGHPPCGRFWFWGGSPTGGVLGYGVTMLYDTDNAEWNLATVGRPVVEVLGCTPIQT
jgi:hypothetical protein